LINYKIRKQILESKYLTLKIWVEFTAVQVGFKSSFST